jgi:phosphatidylglycerophosphatase C
VSGAHSRGRTVAAFDFDGTLTRRDSLVPFLARVRGWPRTLLVLASVFPQYALVALGRADRDATKQRLLVGTLGGIAGARIAPIGDEYGRDLVRDGVTPEMRQRVAWHRAQGHEVVIVSASLDVYLHSAGRALDAQGLLCTRLEVDGDGTYTGRMEGGNCRGPAKATRLRDYLGDVPAEVWAYGNSSGDDEMFAMADHVVRVRRGRLRPASDAGPVKANG